MLNKSNNQGINAFDSVKILVNPQNMEHKSTFEELDAMIDTWTAQLHDHQSVFLNQLSHIKQTFWTVGSNDEKLYEISFKLGILNYMYFQLERELENAKYFQQVLEQQVTELEKVALPLHDKSPTEIARERMYGLTQNINCHLIHCTDELKSLAKESKHYDCINQKDPVEQVAKIMTTLLEQLEVTEMNLEQIQNKIHWMDSVRYSILKNLT